MFYKILILMYVLHIIAYFILMPIVDDSFMDYKKSNKDLTANCFLKQFLWAGTILVPIIFFSTVNSYYIALGFVWNVILSYIIEIIYE